MRTLKLGEMIVATGLSAFLALIAFGVNADDTVARAEWTRSCSLSAKNTTETYTCGKFQQSYNTTSGWTAMLLQGRPMPVVCTATRKPWPQNDLHLDCKA